MNTGLTTWPEVSLGNVCEFRYGKSLPERTRKAGVVPVFGSNGIVGSHDEAFTDGPTIIVGRKGSFGEVHFSPSACWPIDTTYYIDRSATKVDLRWLAYRLEALGLKELNRAAAVPGLNREDAYRRRLLLPPVLEQRRIAEILDRAEALRSRRHQALAQLDGLSAAIFFDLFGDHKQSPVTIGQVLEDHAQGWRWELLTDVARLATGHTPDRKRRDYYWKGDTPWITLTEIRQLDGTIAEHTAESITQAGIAHSSAVKLPPGTVCFSRTASIGFVTVMGREMATSQDFVNWVCGPRLDSTYLMHALMRSRRRLRSLSIGSTHKTIYFSTVEQFRVLVPPLLLQKEFASRITAVEKVKRAHRASIDELDALFAALQYRAFHGEI